MQQPAEDVAKLSHRKQRAYQLLDACTTQDAMDMLEVQAYKDLVDAARTCEDVAIAEDRFWRARYPGSILQYRHI